jgi:phosphopantetheinyl transferase
VSGIVVVRHDFADPDTVPRLSAGDRSRLRDLGRDADRTRFLAGRTALLRAAVRAGEPDIVIDATCPDCGAAHGRPRALGASRPLFLALAHAAGVAFAVADRVPVGIDAEPLVSTAERPVGIDAEPLASGAELLVSPPERPVGPDAQPLATAPEHQVGPDAEPLAAAPDRRAAIDDLAPGHGDALRRWTVIEAVLKADGRGLRVPPDAVRVGLLRAWLEGRRYRVRSLRSAGCVVTVARGQRESDGSAV